MKHPLLISAACLGFLIYPQLVNPAGTTSVETLFVFKLDGTKHCEPHSGIDLNSMALELAGAGIEIFSKRKGYDGREGIAVCGAPTGQINIYEIAASDLASALSLGFKQLRE
jgi:hypothetical protein